MMLTRQDKEMLLLIHASSCKKPEERLRPETYEEIMSLKKLRGLGLVKRYGCSGARFNKLTHLGESMVEDILGKSKED